MSKKVEIYTWAICPFCQKLKKLLDEEGVHYKEYDIYGKNAELEALKAKTGSGTVPQVFVEGVFYGGCDDVYALYDQNKFDEIFKTLFMVK